MRGRPLALPLCHFLLPPAQLQRGGGGWEGDWGVGCLSHPCRASGWPGPERPVAAALGRCGPVLPGCWGQTAPVEGTGQPQAWVREGAATWAP